MPAILLVAHAPLASSLRDVAAHVYPDCGRLLVALDVDPAASSEQVAAQVRAALAALGEREALILADVFGATPCNAALECADGVRVRVVSGSTCPCCGARCVMRTCRWTSSLRVRWRAGHRASCRSVPRAPEPGFTTGRR